MVKSVKAKNVSVPETDDLLRELKGRERELENREKTLEENKKRIVRLKEDFKIAEDQAGFQEREFSLIMNDPLGYDKSEEYAEFRKDLARYQKDLLNVQQERNSTVLGESLKVLEEQNERCVEDLKSIGERVNELKTLLEK